MLFYRLLQQSVATEPVTYADIALQRSTLEDGLLQGVPA
jgi:hypothetical protein